MKFDRIKLNETGDGREEDLFGKTWKDNGNMVYGEIKRKGKGKRMRVSGKESAEVTERKEK